MRIAEFFARWQLGTSPNAAVSVRRQGKGIFRKIPKKMCSSKNSCWKFPAVITAAKKRTGAGAERATTLRSAAWDSESERETQLSLSGDKSTSSSSSSSRRASSSSSSSSRGPMQAIGGETQCRAKRRFNGAALSRTRPPQYTPISYFPSEIYASASIVHEPSSVTFTAHLENALSCSAANDSCISVCVQICRFNHLQKIQSPSYQLNNNFNGFNILTIQLKLNWV